MLVEASFFLLPLWEKVARTKSAPDEGSFAAERNPSPVFASRSHPLPQGERGRGRCLPRLRWLQPARQHGPIAAGENALQEVHHAGVVADQDARLVVLDALDDAQRGGGGRGPGDAVEPLDRSRAALIVGHACAGAGGADDVGGDAAGCTTDTRTGLA